MDNPIYSHKILMVPLTAIEHLYLHKLAEAKGTTVVNVLRAALSMAERKPGKPSAADRREQVRYERRLCESMGLEPDKYCGPDPGPEENYAPPPARPVGRPRLPLPPLTEEQKATYEMHRQMNEYNRQTGKTHLPRLAESREEEREQRLRERAEKQSPKNS